MNINPSVAVAEKISQAKLHWLLQILQRLHLRLSFFIFRPPA